MNRETLYRALVFTVRLRHNVNGLSLSPRPSSQVKFNYTIVTMQSSVNSMIFFLLQFFIGSLSSSSIFRAHRLCFVYSLPAQIFEHSIIFAQGKKCCLQATEIFHFSLIHSNIFSKTGPLTQLSSLSLHTKFSNCFLVCSQN